MSTVDMELVEKPEEENKIDANSESDNAFAYLNRGDFTAEKFKIEIRGLPKFYGISELKKLLKDELKLDTTKLKSPRSRNSWVYVCFRSEEARNVALDKLNGYKWKGRILSANKAEPAPDPLVKKRKEIAESEIDPKKLKTMTQDELLQNTTVPYYQFPYEEQLKLKHKAVRDVLLKLGNSLWQSNPILRSHIEEQRKKFDGLPCEMWDIRSAKINKGYRNKCEFTIGIDSETKLPTVGFRLGSYVNGFTGVAPVDNLVHIPDRMKVAVNVFQMFVRNYNSLRVYNPESHAGEFKLLTARWSSTSDELMLIVGVQTKEMSTEAIDKLKQDLKEFFVENGEGASAKVTSLFFKKIQRRLPNEPFILAEHLSGTTYIHEQLLGLKFRVSPEAFFQVNTQGAEVLYSTAIELTQPTDQTSVLDICCGTGTIGLCFSKHCGQVLGLDLIGSAVADAKANAEANKIENAEFFEGKAEEILLSVAKKSKFEEIIAVVDPPRAGLHQKGIIQLRQTRNLKKLLYVSCDPSAALKNFIDLGRPPSKTLQYEPFVPVKAVAVDLFPHTKHCEMLIYFERFKYENDTDDGIKKEEEISVQPENNSSIAEPKTDDAPKLKEDSTN